MTENRVVALRQKGAIDDPLTEILRTGARRLIAQAVEAEFETFLASTAELVLPDGRRRVVRHGHDPVRAIQTGIGSVEVQKPKARDRGATPGARIRFMSNILPKWARRTKSLDALLPVLYLRGISAAISRRPSRPCSARTRPTFPRLLSRASRANGRTNIDDGRSAICRRAITSTFGRTASICRRAWSRRPNACWC